jgi:signal-transduction protein with cAMP-binding, CBS, and nucleotidyltransferase domain
VGCVVVVNDSRPVGIVTDRDIVLGVVASARKPAETAVREIMTANLTTVNVNYDMLDAVRLMRSRGVRRLPVVDEHRHLLGIITMDDTLAAFGAEIGDLAGAVKKELDLEAQTPAAIGNRQGCRRRSGLAASSCHFVIN